MDGESIYRLVPVETEPAPQPPLYRSKYPGAVSPKTVPCSQLGVRNIRAAATMGPGSGQVPVSPSRFLLAHEKEPVLPARKLQPLVMHSPALSTTCWHCVHHRSWSQYILALPLGTVRWCLRV
jgi:hypothetical protein